MKEYLKGLNFYEIKIQKTSLALSSSLRMCTYRAVEVVEALFQDQKKQYGHK